MDLQKQCDEHVQIPDVRPVSPWRQFWVQSWHDALVFVGLRKDWTDPNNAPPAFPEVKPHVFMQMPDLLCCPRCGGGRNHPIHDVKGANDAQKEECGESESAPESAA